MKIAFTLVELLVVVAVVAVIGAGVAVYYGREVVDNANAEMTLHEMGLIRDAFQRFYADNSAQMMNGMTKADSPSSILPDGDFDFAAGDRQTYDASGYTAENPQRLYGAMQFLERYGLWPLLRSSIYSATERRNVTFFASSTNDSEFRAPSASGGGWRGPYA